MPINNPIPLIADNNMFAKFEKIPWINTQVIDRKWCGRTDGWTDGRTDGRTDRRTDTEGYNIIPRHTLVAGYKNATDSMFVLKKLYRFYLKRKPYFINLKYDLVTRAWNQAKLHLFFRNRCLSLLGIKKNHQIAFSYVTRGIIWKIYMQELWFLCRTTRLNVLYKCMKFLWNIARNEQSSNTPGGSHQRL